MNHQTAIMLTGEALEHLARDLLYRAGPPPRPRTILGIAGIPGSGKSTLALELADLINNIIPQAAALAPMDGFHLPNEMLEQRGLVERKGAPNTFDTDAYLLLLARCRDLAGTVCCPRYDRTVHEPVRDDHPLYNAQPGTRIIITEGNYLLLQEQPWSDLAAVLTETWWLRTPLDTARRWLLARHLAVGRSREEAERRYANDLANTRLVMDNSRPADRVLCWPG